MKNRGLYISLGVLVLVCGLIALGFYVYNLGATSAAVESMELPSEALHHGYFHPVLGGVLALIGLMILLRIVLPLILFPLFGIGYLGTRKWWGHGPRHWRHMDWEHCAPPMVHAWHHHLHEMEENPEAPAEE